MGIFTTSGGRKPFRIQPTSRMGRPLTKIMALASGAVLGVALAALALAVADYGAACNWC